MKTMFRNFGYGCLAAITAGATTSNAQDGFTTGVSGRAGTNLRLFQGEGRALPMPGRVWVETNIGDGVGYEGSYFTVGGKTHLADDFLDGRWLLETQGHVSENGGFFSNVGLERVFSLKKAGADLTLGGWLDYDGDEVGPFAHSYWQAAFNASVRTARWDLIGNAYVPLGDTVYTQGELGRVSFYESNIALQAGLDTALQGYDVTFRAKPMQFANYNGNIDLGLYGYESDAVRYFTGVRARAGLQTHRGWRVSGEINRDDLFGWTGVLQLGYTWGVNDRGIYAGLGNDLDPTLRNDHIVRFQQQLVLAIDPDTGLPYNVLHVDNFANGTGIGTFESRFHTLAAAEAVSAPDDIIFVHRGDGTTSGYDMGITLKDRQLFLGSGVQHIIPLAGGTSVFLPNVVDGLRPTITNTAGPAVRIDGSDTVVRGFVMDGAGPGVFMSHGILADGILNPINNFRIEDVAVRNAVLDGIRIDNAAGDINIVRALIEENGRDGISITNFGTPDSDIAFRDVVVQDNQRDGVHMNNYDLATVRFQENFSANGNRRHGIFMSNFLNTAGVGGTFAFLNTDILDNVSNGIHIENADGNFLFQNLNVQGNGLNGLGLVGVSNTNPLHATRITSTLTGTSQFIGNGGAGIFNNLNIPNRTQRLLIEFSTMNSNQVGIVSQVDGIGANLTTNIVDNFGVANNIREGIVLRSINGGLHNALVTNTTLGRLNMNGNGNGGGTNPNATGHGIRMFSGDEFSVDTSTLNAVISNVSFLNIGYNDPGFDIFPFPRGTDFAIFGGTGNAGLLNVLVDDVQVGNAGTGFGFLFNTQDTSLISRVTVRNSVVGDFSAQGADRVFGARARGMTFSTLAGSAADLVVDNVVFQNDFLDHILAEGVLLSNEGLLRVQFSNNEINEFDGFGLLVQTGGTGRTLGNFFNNRVFSNGPLQDEGAPPHEDGVRFANFGNATANIRFVDNLITENFEQGLTLTTAQTSQMNFEMTGNVIAYNDQGGPNPPDQFVFDMLVVNGINANIGLSMSTNAFLLPAAIDNNSGAPAFILELDGTTNGVGFPTIVGGPVTQAQFGSTVDPAIAAEEAAFIGLGF